MSDYRTLTLGSEVTAVQWQPFVGGKLPAGVRERSRTWLDRLLRLPVNVDRNWYVDTPNGRVWLSAYDWIVSVRGSWYYRVIDDELLIDLWVAMRKEPRP